MFRPRPDKHHPLWPEATDTKRDHNGKKTKTPKYPRRNSSVVMQLATDHAFTGSYVQRFRPNDRSPKKHFLSVRGTHQNRRTHPFILPAVYPTTHHTHHPQHGFLPCPPPLPLHTLLLSGTEQRSCANSLKKPPRSRSRNPDRRRMCHPTEFGGSVKQGFEFPLFRLYVFELTDLSA
ncbi:hypothetical protein EDB89DRAFT_1638643 [Lactarius sanguifluus]|nr:hypothetical protein EDB89DRAFT_1638643 [Lactarius sanguifluus]